MTPESWTIDAETQIKVSNLGQVMINGKPSWGWKNKDGYMQVRHNGKWEYVHRLVLRNFKPNPKPWLFSICDHRNRIKNDNHYINLRWSDQVLNSLNTDAANVLKVKQKKRIRWRARFRLYNKNVDIGTYNSRAEAKLVVERAKQAARDVIESCMWENYTDLVERARHAAESCRTYKKFRKYKNDLEAALPPTQVA